MYFIIYLVPPSLHDLFFTPVSIVSDASAASNGGKWELMHNVHYVSSHLPPLDAADASDTIDTEFHEQSVVILWVN